MICSSVINTRAYHKIFIRDIKVNLCLNTTKSTQAFIFHPFYKESFKSPKIHCSIYTTSVKNIQQKYSNGHFDHFGSFSVNTPVP